MAILFVPAVAYIILYLALLSAVPLLQGIGFDELANVRLSRVLVRRYYVLL